MSRVTVAICTYNRAARLPALVEALRAQDCPEEFDVLIVNNNSTDGTQDTLARLAASPGPRLRHVVEPEQGIVPARNRALRECLDSEFVLMMDDDELPRPGWVAAGFDALSREGADCVGGAVTVNFDPYGRPRWLTKDLLGFLAEVDHGNRPFWIEGGSHAVWTANVGYRMSLFRSDPSLRFDRRYNREGADLGGGEDAMMFRALVSRGVKIRYRPDMVVDHFVEPWRLRRTYFLKLHFVAGRRFGRYSIASSARNIGGVPTHLYGQALRQGGRTLALWMRRKEGWIRQAMNFTHALGMIAGCRDRRNAER